VFTSLLLSSLVTILMLPFPPTISDPWFIPNCLSGVCYVARLMQADCRDVFPGYL
jgi:hypothetical protein